LPTLANLTSEATGSTGAAVTFTLGNATDAVSGNRTCTANPTSGSLFQLGNSTVTVTSSDVAGNTVTGNFTIWVCDTTPPTLPALPTLSSVTREATGPGGAAVTFTLGNATDLVDGSRTVTATPASGSTFPVGNSTVTVSSSDTRGNTATGNFTVRVVDTTPPTLTLPANKVVAASGASGAVVTFTTSANDTVSGARPTSATPASGSTFPIGTTTVNVSASDAAGNPASGSFKVTVVNMKTLLQNVVISPGGSNSPSISGLIQGGPPGTAVFLQASADLGQADPWQDIATITLDSSGNKSFGPIADPQGSGLTRDFFRIKLPLNP
jgi:hypothetical protein